MENHGGFEHNHQSLRVVEHLEHRYPDFPGLNLTFELREGILKHETIYDKPAIPAEYYPDKRSVLECQIVSVADEIAYTCHDVDDGLNARLFSVDELLDLKLWRDLHTELLKQYPEIEKTSLYRYQMVRLLVNRMITDTVESSQKALAEYKPLCPDDVRTLRVNLICQSKQTLDEESEIKDFLNHNMYCHYLLVRMAEKAERIISTLFEAYTGNPNQLPPGYKSRINDEDAFTVVADYIAGMTDRYAGQEYKKLTDPFEIM